MITAERLRELLRYDPETSVFTWLPRYFSARTRRRRKAGQMNPRDGAPAGWIRRDGYLEISVLGREYKAHRLAFLYMNGEWPKGDIDHINHIPGDNR